MQKDIQGMAPSTMKVKIIARLKGNTLSGSEVPFFLLCPLSNKCGFPNKNTMSLVHPLFTGNASKLTLSHRSCICLDAKLATLRVCLFMWNQIFKIFRETLI